MTEILPSIFAADLMALKKEILFLEDQGFQTLHVDMMDGNLVPNITFGPDQIKAIKQNTSIKIDVHMMVHTPEKIVNKLIDIGVDMISIHYEATIHHCNILQHIRNAGIKAAISYNPSTSLESLKYLKEFIDYVLLMSVNPGHDHQSFYPITYQRIQDAKAIIGSRDIAIQVDGGVNDQIAPQLKEAGVSLIVIGGYLFRGNRSENIQKLKEIIK